MELTEILATYKITAQLYISMGTTAFIVVLYLLRNVAKDSKDISDWLGFYALGIPISGYGCGLGVYVAKLLVQYSSMGELSLGLLTVMPVILIVVNGFAFFPIAVFVVKTMREEMPKNCKRKNRAEA